MINHHYFLQRDNTVNCQDAWQRCFDIRAGSSQHNGFESVKVEKLFRDASEIGAGNNADARAFVARREVVLECCDWFVLVLLRLIPLNQIFRCGSFESHLK